MESSLSDAYHFAAGEDGWVEIRNDGADGYVSVDAVQFVRVSVRK
jgi:hypothetical protein